MFSTAEDFLAREREIIGRSIISGTAVYPIRVGAVCTAIEVEGEMIPNKIARHAPLGLGVLARPAGEVPAVPAADKRPQHQGERRGAETEERRQRAQC